MRSKQRRQLVGLTLGTVPVAVAAMFDWQVPGVVAMTTLLAIAMLGGAIGARIVVPPGHRFVAQLVAVLAGAAAAAGAFGLVRWWVAERSSVYSVEVALVGMIGALPGAVLGQRLFERATRSSNP